MSQLKWYCQESFPFAKCFQTAFPENCYKNLWLWVKELQVFKKCKHFQLICEQHPIMNLLYFLKSEPFQCKTKPAAAINIFESNLAFSQLMLQIGAHWHQAWDLAKNLRNQISKAKILCTSIRASISGILVLFW